MKRLYKLVSTQKTPGGFSILLDGKPVKTPSRNPLLAPGESIASRVVREWAEQGATIKPDTMPFTQILTTKIDRVSAERTAMTQGVLKYLDTDLLCYRAGQPPELVASQRKIWDPWLVWFGKIFDVELLITTDLKALRQPEKAHKGVRTLIESLDDDRFTVLQLVTALSGSVVLALAFIRGGMSAAQVFEATRVEESYKAGLYNEEKYGPDPAQEKKDKAAKIDLQAASDYLASLS